jgi:hypothetical protein
VILAGPLPALLSRTTLDFDDLLYHHLPSSFGSFWITGSQIGAGDVAIDGRLLLRLVLYVQESLGREFVVGLKALPFACEPVENVEKTTLAAINSES